MQTGPTARHSPIGSFQRVCYVVRLHSIAAAASCSERLIDCQVDCQPLGRTPFCWHIGGRGRAVYLQRWTATDSLGPVGMLLDLAAHSGGKSAGQAYNGGRVCTWWDGLVGVKIAALCPPSVEREHRIDSILLPVIA
jgi:hypothetical protein